MRKYKYIELGMHNVKDPLVAFARFVENRPDRMRDFENGKIFFPSYEYFIRLEEKTGNSNIGDMGEGGIVRHIPIKDLISMKADNELLSLSKNGELKIIKRLPEAALRNNGMLSLISIRYSDLEKNGQIYRVKKRMIDDMKRITDGNRQLYLMCNHADLLSEVYSKGYSANWVNYYNPYKGLGGFLTREISQHPIMMMYQKRSLYAYQHEYRIMKPINKSQFETFTTIPEGLMKLSLDDLATLNIHLIRKD